MILEDLRSSFGILIDVILIKLYVINGVLHLMNWKTV